MHERPAGIRDSDVAAGLARQWALMVQDLSHLPVGFGGYHWLAVGQTGSRWFMTVSDPISPWVPDLAAAMQTAAWLATGAGLGFVVAPVPTRAGQVVGSLDSRHALYGPGPSRRSLRPRGESAATAAWDPARAGSTGPRAEPNLGIRPASFSAFRQTKRG